MTKPLTEHEESVLQENFDLFGSNNTSNNAAPKLRKPRKRPAQTGATNTPLPLELLIDPEQPSNSPEAANQTPPPTTHKLTNSAPPHLNSPEKLLAVRATSANAAADQLSQLGINVINYSMEKRDPALKNVADALLDLELEFRIENQSLHWVLVDDERQEAQLLECNFIELVLTCAWFDGEKQKIRRLRGRAYIDACTELARQLSLKDQTRTLESATQNG